MIDTKLRKTYDRYFINPILKFSKIHAVSPHHITAFAVILGISTAPLLYMQWIKTAIIVLVLSGILDTLDGAVARLKKTDNPKGAVLDINCDRLVEFSIILGIYFMDPLKRGLPCLLMLGSVLFCITSFLVVGIFTKNESEKSFHYSPGIIERTEAFILFISMILFPNYFLILSLVFSFLVLATAIKRVYEFVIPKYN